LPTELDVQVWAEQQFGVCDHLPDHERGFSERDRSPARAKAAAVGARRLDASHPVTCWQEALNVIGYYERRPLVEEFHKALKTGCRIEGRLYETAARWENLTGLLSIVAVRLLQLKTIATKQPDLPAASIVPLSWLQRMLALRGNKRKKIVTARDFLRALAGLGGHLGGHLGGKAADEDTESRSVGDHRGQLLERTLRRADRQSIPHRTAQRSATEHHRHLR